MTGGRQFADVWKRFYRPAVHEPEIDDPLIAAGREMVPAIVEAIRHREMRYRRYAIGALGYIGDERALPPLAAILGDRSERDYFRADALKAIYQINKAEGLRRAVPYRDADGILGAIARSVLEREAWLREPSQESGEE